MINEPIINAKFKKFKTDNGLESLVDGEAFERFVNNAILTSHQPDAFSADSELLDALCVGGPSDTGIDGVAIKVNGILIKSIAEIDDIIAKYKIEIEFIFIQSKFKQNYDSGEFNNFLAGVRNFLDNSGLSNLPMNEKLTNFHKLKNYILSDDIVYRWEKNPSVRLYYVAMGTWKDDKHLTGLAETAKRDISNLKAYDEIGIHFIDNHQLNNVISNNENNFTTIIETIDTMSLTPVAEVIDSCIALCTANEFIKLLKTDEGVIRKSLFDDNVRDFQGQSGVNTEILTTIENSPSKFILLNNGITIVCDEFVATNRKLKIVNPQIVNGCQTSHVIFDAWQKGLSITDVPLNIKVISTKNQDVSNDIVRGTNRQNIVLDEAFEATKEFHKSLEEFFNHYSNGLQNKIYYERRAKQYSHNPLIKQTQKINLRILTQYFCGMFFNKPHNAHRHESILIKELQNNIFRETHSRLPYFVASYSFFSLEKLFREHDFFPELKPYKPHLLMIFREAVAGERPRLELEKEIDKHCSKLIEILRDENRTKEIFTELGTLFNSVIQIWIKDLKRSKYAIKDVEDFTNLLLMETRKKYSIIVTPKANSEDTIFTGFVLNTLVDRSGLRFGFIKRYPENLFFHFRQNPDLDFRSLDGRQVSYKIKSNQQNGRQYAVDVKLVEANN